MARIEVDKLVKLSSEKKIDNVSEVFERREIKRNISNQIISYTLADGSNTKYGILRLPATRTVYNANQYNRAIDRLSDDLAQQVDVDGNVFVDTFSGRYEITRSSKIYNGALDRQDINIVFDTIPWDNVVNGPTLEDGAYRITKELIDSGKNLRLKAIVAISNDAGANLFTQVRFQRKRILTPPGSGFEFSENEVLTGLGNVHQIVYEINNSEMFENDLWEVQVRYVSNTEDGGIYMIGDESLFEVELVW